VFFELNGQPRDVSVVDRSLQATAVKPAKADPANPKEVGAGMPGMVVTVAVKAGDKVTKGQKLFTVEAMKMETTINSDVEGRIAEVFVKAGSRVEAGDLLLRVE
jgi:pyruvate carboxylase